MRSYLLTLVTFFSLPLFAGDRLIVNDRIEIQSNTTSTSILLDQRSMFDSNTCKIKYDLRLFSRTIENQVFMIVNDQYSYIKGDEAVKLYVENAGVIQRIQKISNSNDPLPSTYNELKALLVKNNIKINSAESDFLYTKVNLNLISQDTNNTLTIECKLLGYQSYDEALLYLNDRSYFKIDQRY